jgi:hypothetical protein
MVVLAMNGKTKDEFSPEEAQRRFEAALRGARIAGHKPKEIVTRSASKPQRGRPKKKR